MNYYFITGTSRGIGRALAELLLQNKDNFVFGMSRSNEITGNNFTHIKSDLNDLESVKNYEFPVIKNADSIVLVNNSASTAEVLHLGKRTPSDIIENFNVNLISPTLLINSFLKKYQNENCRRIIMNISSGAAFRPIEAWSSYCAGKAGLAMVSEVMEVEQKIKHPENPVRVFNFGPGVVDTQMQANLRKVSPEDFSMVGTFIDYHKDKKLSDPSDVAMKLNQILQNPNKYEKVSMTVNEV
ncbi:MAG TPA: SDR family NAD(P)-dependent oxidoreductase [Ignavibacteria bacterium]|nr:SDR family NAD(P)-dependent oxidoreductase [Ignavibacteria bacterium]